VLDSRVAMATKYYGTSTLLINECIYYNTNINNRSESLIDYCPELSIEARGNATPPT